jgi:hypothetical protein
VVLALVHLDDGEHGFMVLPTLADRLLVKPAAVKDEPLHHDERCDRQGDEEAVIRAAYQHGHGFNHERAQPAAARPRRRPAAEGVGAKRLSA